MYISIYLCIYNHSFYNLLVVKLIVKDILHTKGEMKVCFCAISYEYCVLSHSNNYSCQLA